MSEKKLTREADTSTLYEFKGSVPKPSLLVPLSAACTSSGCWCNYTIHYHCRSMWADREWENDDDSGSVAPYCHCNITTVIPDF